MATIRAVIALALFSTAAFAGVLSFSALCTDAASVTTADSMSCDGVHTSASVFATFGNSSADLSVRAAADKLDHYDNWGGSATASFDANYLVTIHGGTGLGRIAACFDVTGGDTGPFASGAGTASYTVNGQTVSVGGWSHMTEETCGTGGGLLVPFDVPTPLTIHLYATATASAGTMYDQGGYAEARWNGIRLSDFTALDIVNGSVTLVELPEPGAAGLAVAGMVVIGALFKFRSRSATS
jgi:hypothetical protein